MNLIEHIRQLLNPGMPRKYIVCDFCGAMDWGTPPHGFGEPCPHASKILDSMSMKVDAERNLAARSGIHLEEMRSFLQDMYPKAAGDDDE